MGRGRPEEERRKTKQAERESARGSEGGKVDFSREKEEEF